MSTAASDDGPAALAVLANIHGEMSIDDERKSALEIEEEEDDDDEAPDLVELVAEVPPSSPLASLLPDATTNSAKVIPVTILTGFLGSGNLLQYRYRSQFTTSC